MPEQNRVTVRMYNVGFGDAFVVTVHRDDRTWRMLVDCGVHKSGQVHSIQSVVETIIADLRAESANGEAHLDVVVATHRHADHISGFARPEWAEVTVGEVWLSFVEDLDDEDARGLRESHDATATALLELVESRTASLGADSVPDEIADGAVVRAQLADQPGRARSAARSQWRRVRATALAALPPRRHAGGQPSWCRCRVWSCTCWDRRATSARLKQMDPPRSAGWLRLDVGGRAREQAAGIGNLFAAGFRVPEDQAPAALRKALRSLNLADVTNDAGVLAAAALLERVVNNTSLFFVLDVAGTRLLFPGDSQHGAWQHVLADDQNRELVRDCAFYKIGHHGSHNATPKEFVSDLWQDGAYAMLPWGLVKRWQDCIPKRELMDALGAHLHPVIRMDAQQPVPGVVEFHDDLWSQLTIPTQ